MVIAATTHRFTVEEYYKMAEAGIFWEDDRVELIEGEIIDMAPIGRKHSSCVDRANDQIARRLGERGIVRVQSPVRISARSDPQPDVVVLRRRPDYYSTVDAGPDDELLIIEVADSSLAYDRDVKVPLYARAGIPEVWLEDLIGESILVYRDPSPEGYRQIFEVRGDERLSPVRFPDLVLSAIDLLGTP